MGLDSMPIGNSINEWRLQEKRALVPEAPSFVELENYKFIILSFEGDGKDKELKLKSSKIRKGVTELQEKTRNMKNQRPNNNECAKRRRSRNNSLEKVEIESDSIVQWCRFLHVSDKQRMENRLADIWVGSYHVFVSIARFNRDQQKNKQSSGKGKQVCEEPIAGNSIVRVHVESRHGSPSYANVVQGTKEINIMIK
ncbi:hypothetical protein LXL04_003690 [Taraxacum kok-saghyz]